MTATHPKRPGWARPATFYFRRAGSVWQTVGTTVSLIRTT
jgi:hypothetical protein